MFRSTKQQNLEFIYTTVRQIQATYGKYNKILLNSTSKQPSR